MLHTKGKNQFLEFNILKMSFDVNLLGRIQKVLSLCASATLRHLSAPPPYLFLRTISQPRAELSELPRVICNIKKNLKSSLSLNKNSAAIIQFVIYIRVSIVSAPFCFRICLPFCNRPLPTSKRRLIFHIKVSQ